MAGPGDESAPRAATEILQHKISPENRSNSKAFDKGASFLDNEADCSDCSERGDAPIPPETDADRCFIDDEPCGDNVPPWAVTGIDTSILKPHPQPQANATSAVECGQPHMYQPDDEAADDMHDPDSAVAEDLRIAAAKEMDNCRLKLNAKKAELRQLESCQQQNHPDGPSVAAERRRVRIRHIKRDCLELTHRLHDLN